MSVDCADTRRPVNGNGALIRVRVSKDSADLNCIEQNRTMQGVRSPVNNTGTLQKLRTVKPSRCIYSELRIAGQNDNCWEVGDYYPQDPEIDILVFSPDRPLIIAASHSAVGVRSVPRSAYAAVQLQNIISSNGWC